MPEVKKTLVRRLIERALKEAELTAGPENTKFNIEILVSNPQSETKQGIRIRLKPKEGLLEPEKQEGLSAAIMTKFNDSLKKFNIQISSDTDTQDPEAMGFFIPLDHIKSMIKTALGTKSNDSKNNEKPPSPNSIKKAVPAADIDSLNKLKSMGDDNEPLNEMRQRDLKEISQVVVKEDFYNFINAGNNVLRSLEENGVDNGKKYLSYLVKHNIM